MTEEKNAEIITCPVCEIVIQENVDLCPECGWEIDRSANELIIGDSEELKREVVRKQQRMVQYRTLYQQAKRSDELEARVIEQQKELEKNTMKLKGFENHRITLEKRYLKQMFFLVLLLIGIMVGGGVLAKMQMISVLEKMEKLEKQIVESAQLKKHIAEVEALQVRIAEIENSNQTNAQEIEQLEDTLENIWEMVKPLL